MSDLTDREIKMSHTIDDLAVDLGKLRRTVRQQAELLTDGLHAIRNGRYGVAEEFMERARDSLAEKEPRTRILRCGYCQDDATAWMEWETTGRPKGSPVCDFHGVTHNTPNNFGRYPAFRQLGYTKNPGS